MITPQYKWIEQIRSISMLLVVMSHAADFSLRSFNHGQSKFWHTCISSVITIAVPTFFLVSGYLVAIKNKRSDIHIFRLIIPYIIWSTIYAFVGQKYMDLNLFSGVGLFQITTGYLHLYFLFALIQLHLWYMLIRSSLNKNNCLNMVVLFIFFTFLVYAAIDISVWLYGDLQIHPEVQFLEYFAMKIGATWAAFFFIGVFFGFRPIALKSQTYSITTLSLLTLVALALFILERNLQTSLNGHAIAQYYFISGFFYQLFGSLLLVAVFKKTENSKYCENKVMLYLAHTGQYTFGIYLIHPLLIIVFLHIFNDQFLLTQNASLYATLTLFPLSWFLSKLLTMGWERLSRCEIKTMFQNRTKS